MHGKSIANKTSCDNIILVKPLPGARTKVLKHYVSPDLEKKPDLVILHTVTNDLKSVSSPEEIANEITSLALSVKEKGHQIAVSGILPRGDSFSKKAKNVNDCLEIKCKDHNIDFISNKNINTRSHLNQDRLHPTRKGQYMMGNNFSTFINNFYFRKLIPTTSIGMSGDCISKSQNSNEIRKEVKNGKDQNAFSLRRKQRLDYPKNVIFGHINSPQNKFESISELIKGKFDIFLIKETKLDASFPSNQFAMSGYKFVRKDRNKFGGGIAFYINDQLPSRPIKFENPSDVEILTIEITIRKYKILVAGIYKPPNLLNHRFCY